MFGATNAKWSKPANLTVLETVQCQFCRTIRWQIFKNFHLVNARRTQWLQIKERHSRRHRDKANCFVSKDSSTESNALLKKRVTGNALSEYIKWTWQFFYFHLLIICVCIQIRRIWMPRPTTFHRWPSFGPNGTHTCSRFTERACAHRDVQHSTGRCYIRRCSETHYRQAREQSETPDVVTSTTQQTANDTSGSIRPIEINSTASESSYVSWIKNWRWFGQDDQRR